MVHHYFQFLKSRILDIADIMIVPKASAKNSKWVTKIRDLGTYKRVKLGSKKVLNALCSFYNNTMKNFEAIHYIIIEESRKNSESPAKRLHGRQ